MQDPTLFQSLQGFQEQQQEEQVIKCPRCDSTNTKFCYYNNYNLSQPRHFCKNCKRYWTKGGTLRNIPIGGKTRKNKKPSSSTSTSKRVHATSASSDPTRIQPDPHGGSFQGSLLSSFSSSGDVGNIMEGVNSSGLGLEMQRNDGGDGDLRCWDSINYKS